MEMQSRFYKFLFFCCLISLTTPNSLLSKAMVFEVLLEGENSIVIKFEYSNIQELKQKAGVELRKIDNEIRLKLNVANNPLNPFKEMARSRLNELEKQRADFLALKWKCPHDSFFSFLRFGRHPSPDQNEKCGITIGELLRVK